MKGDLLINGKDAFNTWGVNMGDSFLNSLLTPPPVKGHIENKSRLEDGKMVIAGDKKSDERDITLTFTIQGVTQSDYLSKYKSFIGEMSSGMVSIKVPVLGSDIYHVYYKNAVSYGMSVERTFCKLSIKVCEPNPANRG